MSIFNSFRRALGIGDEYSEDDYQESLEPSHIHEEDNRPSSATLRAQATVDKSLAHDILESIVNYFNSSQPDFIQKCLNTDEQKKYLYEAIDSGLRRQVERAIEQGHEAGLRQWEEEKKALSDEVEKLKREKSDFESKRDESKSALLSAERQKRAMSERIRDLETQLSKLSAENEQLHLENRSLMNKIRVAGIKAQNGEGADVNAFVEMEEELKSLKGEYEQYKDNTTKEIESLKDENSRLAKENEDRRELLEQAKSFTLENDKAKLKSLERDNITLTENLSAAMNEKAELEKKLETAKYIESQLDKIEKSLRKKDEELESARQKERETSESKALLESEIKGKNDEIVRLKKELETQREINQKNIAALQELNRMKGEISVKEVEIVESRQRPETEVQQSLNKFKKRGRPAKEKPEVTDKEVENEGDKKKSAPVISAIDELLDSNDWFVAPDISELVKEPSEPEDFGYKPPQRKQNDELDEKQLSLW